MKNTSQKKVYTNWAFTTSINKNGRMGLITYLSSVELHCKTPRVSQSFGASTLMHNCWKPDYNRGLDSWCPKEISASKMRNVMGNLKESLCTKSPGMNNTLWNALPIKLSKFLKQMKILKENWSCKMRKWDSQFQIIVLGITIVVMTNIVIVFRTQHSYRTCLNLDRQIRWS